MRSRFIPLLLLLGSISPLFANPYTIAYRGDLIPSAGGYGSLFTTLGPGHPSGQYFVGTTWTSDGNVLTMTTVHPNDYAGAPSLGIWFGRGDWYNDSPGFNFAPTTEGNRIDARMALAPNSSEWSLYWYDASG